MRNYLIDGFNAVDNLIMKGANSGVKVWNWTTGRTKSDLAIFLMSLAPLTVGLSAFHNKSPLEYFIAGGFLFATLKEAEDFKSIEDEEFSSLSKGLKSAPAEKAKSWYKVISPIYFTGSASALLAEGLNDVSRCLLGLASSSMGTSYYVMRAENLPPRKNCVNRGIDKLTDIFNSSQGPTPNPI